jgi:hypothetical protein
VQSCESHKFVDFLKNISLVHCAYSAQYTNFLVNALMETSRCPYCAFGFHCKFTGMRSCKSCHSCQIMSFMLNHVIHVKSCHSCQIMSFMSNHVIHVKSCHSCQIMSFMSNQVIYVKSCQIMSFMSNHVVHVMGHCAFPEIH